MKNENNAEEVSSVTSAPKFIEREFKTGDVTYKGRIFTDSKEYVNMLAVEHGKTQKEVMNALVEGYQALQMTRVAQGWAKNGKLTNNSVVEVTALYGTRVSKWGDVAKYVEQAKEVIKKAISSGKLVEADLNDEKIKEVAAKIKIKMEAIDNADLI
jgi:hypothetical protein